MARTRLLMHTTLLLMYWQSCHITQGWTAHVGEWSGVLHKSGQQYSYRCRRRQSEGEFWEWGPWQRRSGHRQMSQWWYWLRTQRWFKRQRCDWQNATALPQMLGRQRFEGCCCELERRIRTSAIKTCMYTVSVCALYLVMAVFLDSTTVGCTCIRLFQ